MMKLLYVLTEIKSKGGVPRIIFDKINYLVRYYDIDVLHIGKPLDQPFYEINDRVRFHCISMENDNSSFCHKVLNVCKLIPKYRAIIKSVRPDVIINANTKILSWIIPFFDKKIPKIVELHQSFDGVCIFNANCFGENSLKGKLLMVLRHICYPKYNRVVVLTEKDKQQWGYKNIDVIPNFTNISYKGTYPIASKTALSIGRLEHQKDFQLMVKAWKIVNQKHPDWHLNIFGEGSMKNELEKLIADCGLEQTVFLKGNTNDVIQEYSNSSFFVSSSRYEGLPLVLIEAQCCGLPCVGFDITGVSDMIKDNETGILVKERTPEQLALGICKLIENPNLRESMHQNTLLDSEQYTKEYVMSKWISLFEKVNAVNGASNQG